MDIEVNLRIPRVKTPALDENGYPIDHGAVRFISLIAVPALPKPGDLLNLETASGSTLTCEVVRANWSDAKELFIVYCKYAKRSIPADEYQGLLHDSKWQMKPLL